MRKGLILSIILVFGIFLIFTLVLNAQQKDMPFGSDADIEFAEKVWKEMENYTDWPMASGYYPGQSPHGKFLRLYYNMVNVGDKNYHIIVKDNFGGEGATMQTVSESPDKYLAAVTIMLQREKGYDPEHNDWFYVKYGSDGSILKNPKGMALAGKVAKGTGSGCIACHANAKDNDYIFSNDQ